MGGKNKEKSDAGSFGNAKLQNLEEEIKQPAAVWFDFLLIL